MPSKVPSIMSTYFIHPLSFVSIQLFANGVCNDTNVFTTQTNLGCQLPTKDLGCIASSIFQVPFESIAKVDFANLKIKLINQSIPLSHVILLKTRQEKRDGIHTLMTTRMLSGGSSTSCIASKSTTWFLIDSAIKGTNRATDNSKSSQRISANFSGVKNCSTLCVCVC